MFTTESCTFFVRLYSPRDLTVREMRECFFVKAQIYSSLHHALLLGETLGKMANNRTSTICGDPKLNMGSDGLVTQVQLAAFSLHTVQ